MLYVALIYAVSLLLVLAEFASAQTTATQKVYIDGYLALTGLPHGDAVKAIQSAIDRTNYMYHGYGANYRLVDSPKDAIVIRAKWNGTNNYAQTNYKPPGIILNSYYPADFARIDGDTGHELGHHLFGPCYQHTCFPALKLKPIEPEPPPPAPAPVPTPDDEGILKARIIAQFREEGYKKGLPMREVWGALKLYKSYLPDVKKAEEKVFGKNKKGGYIEKRVDQLTGVKPNSAFKLVSWPLKQQTPDCAQRAVAKATGISLERSYQLFGKRGVSNEGDIIRVLTTLGYRVGGIPQTVNTAQREAYFRSKVGIARIRNPRGGLAHFEYWNRGRVYNPAGGGSVTGFIEIHGRN